MATTRNIQIRFFALLREQAGLTSLVLQTAAATPAELYRELQARYALTFPSHLLRVSINESYASLSTPLSDGDRVVFIPPIAGG